jgi:hypothetical protein
MGASWLYGASVMNPSIKRYGIIGLVFFAGLIAGVTWTTLNYEGVISSSSSYDVEPDSEILSLAESDIKLIYYRSDALILTAQRARQNDQFSVQINYTDGRNPRQCLASSDLAGQLSLLSKYTAKRQLQLEQAKIEFPKQLGIVEIRNSMYAEMPSPMEFRSTLDRKSIAMLSDGHAAEVTTKIDLFNKLEAGCEALALH